MLSKRNCEYLILLIIVVFLLMVSSLRVKMVSSWLFYIMVLFLLMILIWLVLLSKPIFKSAFSCLMVVIRLIRFFGMIGLGW